MKTLKLSITLLSLIAVASLSATAQTNKVVTTEKTSTLAAESDYMSVELEKKISEYFISGVIPAGLPKYTEGTTEADYKKIIKGWASKNLNLIKEKYHDKILEKNKKAASRKE